MRKIISNMPPKQTLAAMALLSLAVAFLVMFFTSFDTYLHNPTDFIVGWKFLLPVFSLITFGASFGIFAFLLLIWYGNIWTGIVLTVFCGVLATYIRFRLQRLLGFYLILMVVLCVCCLLWIVLIKILKGKTFFDAVMLFLFGVTVAMYVQLMFFNGNMVRLTGDRADYGKLTVPHIVNLMIWVALCIFPFFVWIVKKKKAEIRHYKLIFIVSIIFIGMQSAGLIVTAVATELPAGFEEDARCLSFGPMMKLSTDENIVVFLLDRLDTDYMAETLETYPELNQKLDGFTFYKNNISEYGSTFPSVSTMLTGHYYKYGQSANDYWTQAWKGDTFVGRLKKAGYITNLSIDNMTTYSQNSEIENVADNLLKADSVSVNFVAILEAAVKLSSERLLPYLLKNILVKFPAPFGHLCYTASLPDGQEYVDISGRGDMEFYKYIINHPVTPDAKAETFNFIHLNCSHTDRDKSVRTGGYHIDDATGMIKWEGNFIETTRACFEILDTYFEQMKSAGVYDNTTIILVGDHGAGFNPDAERYRGMTTSLLIKPQKAHGELRTDAILELSNAYFGNSLLDIAGLDYDGVSYFDIIEDKSAALPRRYMQSYDGKDSDGEVLMPKIYEITGDANDWANWK